MTSDLDAALLVALTYGGAVALAGVPVVVLAFVLASSRPAPVGLGFAGGWALGLAAALGVVVAISDVAVAVSDNADGRDGLDGAGTPSSVLLAWVRIVAGVALLVLAARSWRARGTAKQPGWMKGVAGWSARQAFVTGLGLGALNPKNLAIIAGAASSLLAASATPADHVPAVVLFALVGSIGVAGPAIYRVTGGEGAGRALTRGDEWLQTRASVLSAVVLAVLGVIVVVNGATAL
ncbi:GAP family protein [Humibacillus xanthopallidus]|uniref:Sap-like sulfolipid-1-addressing protein n=1 Tax=Humibacillus xanthopallidus TaxID=412689 RepID=A0A543HVF8_9MICO|nr:GAP family protein [Humibacillus xanthopallidus]TQM62347.1 Sap-like sulfolipid-1-addressing protein [Humibacillus xanthopallidus]